LAIDQTSLTTKSVLRISEIRGNQVIPTGKKVSMGEIGARLGACPSIDEQWLVCAGSIVDFNGIEPEQRVGNAGRNILRADGIRNVDLGIIKNTRLSERARIQVRGDIFNLFNERNLVFQRAAGKPSVSLINGQLTVGTGESFWERG